MEEKRIEETVNHLTEIKKDRKKQKRKMPKEISQKIWKKIFYQLLATIGIMLYFVVLNLAYVNMKEERLIGDIKVFAGTFLVIGIVMLEKAYRKESGKYVLAGVELLVLSLHTLSIMHVITLFQYDFRLYLLTSSYVFSIYYVLKSIVIYAKERKSYLKGLSDISEIVKKEEPTKKEATKKTTVEEQTLKKEDKKKINKNNKIEEGKNRKTTTKKTTTQKKVPTKTRTATKKQAEKETTTKKTNPTKKEKIVTKQKATSEKEKSTKKTTTSKKTTEKGTTRKTKAQKTIKEKEEGKEND